ncbi:hypothetical protein HS088_TW11G00932 [Tripterygium wilfordii]|uniref:Uncharacterized protein n=1 Tax=Tripterygium wilfordii TaxID=458696 RepID=A0A7J7D3E5_TRIWF|nr:hypothetical protein HS088_TW11G00932 [Tripterygium wilfordii]
MYRPQRDRDRDSFVIQVTGDQACSSSSSGLVSPNKLNLSAMKLFDRLRKLLMRLVFSLPSSSSSRGSSGTSTMQRYSCSERFDPPKNSCSSYYSSQSHYSEAIADCIEFFNKSSSQDGMNLEGRKSDVFV